MKRSLRHLLACCNHDAALGHRESCDNYYCDGCELPNDVCACDDADEYDEQHDAEIAASREPAHA